MKLLSLDLVRYGSYAGRRFDFGPLPGLHIVHGPNEAGKSTCRRAIAQLLFGIGTQDAHRFRPADLELAARIATEESGTIDVVRRRRTQGDLATPAGEPISDSAWARHIDGMTPELADLLFSLDHVALREGAESLLAGEGEVGRALFSAHLGARVIRQGAQALREEADAIYAPQARKRRLNDALTRASAAKAQVTQQELSSDAVAAQEEGLRAATAKRSEAQTALSACRSEIVRLRRLRQVIPLCVRLSAIRTALRELDGVPELPTDFSAQRHSLARQRAELEATTAELVAALARLEEKLTSLDGPALADTPVDPILQALVAELDLWEKTDRRLDRLRAESVPREEELTRGKAALQIAPEVSVVDLATRLPSRDALLVFERQAHELSRAYSAAMAESERLSSERATLTAELSADEPLEQLGAQLSSLQVERDALVTAMQSDAKPNDPRFERLRAIHRESDDLTATQIARAHDIERARATARRLHIVSAQCQQASARVEAHGSALAEFECRWRAAWPSGISVQSPTEMLAWRDRFDALLVKTEALDKARFDLQAYALEGEGLCQRASTDLQLSPVATPRALLATLRAQVAAQADRREQATRQQERKATWTEERARTEAQLRKTRLRLDAALREEHALFELAGAETPAALAIVEERASRKNELRREERQRESELMDLTGRSVAEVAPEAQGASLAEIDAQLEEAVATAEMLENEAAAFSEDVGSLRRGLELVARSDASLTESLGREMAFTEVASLAEDWLRLRLAALMIEREIERYRQDHQAPVLQSAERILANLTVQSFPRLITFTDARGVDRIAPARANGELAPVESLSDGSRDQLFLALRLAAIEDHFRTAPPFPIVLDDILVHFDDARTAATLSALASLAERTQVFLFTHHENVVTLASQTLPGARIHRLQRESATPFAEEAASPHF